METVKYVTVFCSIFIVQAGAMKMFKIRDVNLQKNSAVEILNSYFDNLDDFTMCGRFRTPFLASTLDIWQNIVSIPSTDMWLLGLVLIINCDTRYDGCNDYYKEILGKILMCGLIWTLFFFFMQGISICLGNHLELLILKTSTIFILLGNLIIGTPSVLLICHHHRN